MFDFLKRFQKKVRTDISALLLIAFVFQLITPILVFADEQGSLGEYEAALRDSICQVMLDQQQQENAPQDRQTEGFVCDWCLRGHMIALAPLPETTCLEHSPHPQIVHLVKGTRTTLCQHSQVWGNIAFSRAPPVFLKTHII